MDHLPRRFSPGFSFWPIVFLWLVLLLPACRDSQGQQQGRSSRPVPVLVEKVVRKTMPVDIKATGSIEAYSVVSVQAQVGGQLQKVGFNEGDMVRKDQVLFVLDRRPFDAAMRELVARRDRNQVLIDNAKRELARYDSLLEKDYVSKEDYDRAKANVDALEASLRADRSAVDAASINLQYATIRSPIEGRTGSLLVQPGNVVKPNDKALVVIRQVKPIFARFSVPEQYVASIRQRMREGKPSVTAHVRDGSPEPEHGELTMLENTVDSATGTIELKALFANELERLWPGQYVDVVLQLRVQQDAIVVPASAIQQSREGEFVYVVSAEGVASVRKVVVNRSVGQESVIESGLSPDEVVVTDGQLQLTSGSKVEIKTGSPTRAVVPSGSASAAPVGSSSP
ncbi:MAG TPA: efflux RND transporter periplasmic adaptor subunit [Polyangiaceae bacterium]|nr:MAG: Multidrug resistance protein MdtA precursor [Deltaproteobacteria bacterium ADurb.Bin207]HNS95952.1 efflux RND transporter periplasmic adaptor subunit [Polyangiaceae bacterium]HNZ22571.1 efflux RND transporter periplasmic adaptor subunit [Polyangiaceae bacterium]HOD25408.1 efflux RND transporter periplasmic adaptor subunit [Polyangiaceae bacterium]HOE50082.1 efflux RND transporter periplasmic adaptor subunit [Polyangiaceae bacterium]